ncbi:MAG TPA: MFS transporter [Caldilineaceae bacterium]|nr:MFS transporter [Caldilineaceae bacterium]
MPMNEVDYSRKWLVMTAIGFASFLETIDSSAITLALPTMVNVFQANFALVQWVVLAFVLTQATLMLVMGRLGDTFGKKPIFLIGVVVAMIGATLCGFAPDIYWLIGLRVIQAAGVAMAAALMFGIVAEAFPPEERGMAMGTIGAIVSIGVVIGPIVGGLLLDFLSWRWLLFLNVPFGLLALPIGLRNIPHRRQGSGGRFDYLGSLIFFLSLAAFLLATTFGQRTSFVEPTILLLLGGALLLFLLFLLVESKVPAPVVDLHLFRERQFSLNLLLRFLSFIIFVSVSLLLPFYLQNMLGFEPRMVGILLTVIPIGFGGIAPVAGTLSDRLGVRPVAMLGLGLLLLGSAAVSTLNADTTILGYVLRVIPFGLGMGIFQSPNNSAIMGSVPSSRLGMASSLLSVIRTLGRSSGVAILGALWAQRVRYHSGPSYGGDATLAPIPAQVAGLQEAFWGVAAVALVALALIIWDRWQERAGPQSPR